MRYTGVLSRAALTLGSITRRGAAAHAARGDAARARRGCRSHSCGAIHRHRYRIAIGGLAKVARSLTRLTTLSAIVARKLGRGRTVLLPCALRRRILLLLIQIGIDARRIRHTDRTIGLGCIRARLARRSARRRIRHRTIRNRRSSRPQKRSWRHRVHKY